MKSQDQRNDSAKEMIVPKNYVAQITFQQIFKDNWGEFTCPGDAKLLHAFI